MRNRSRTSRIYITTISVGLLGLLWLLSAPPATAQDVDNDGDGIPASIDCDDDNAEWNENCWLIAYQGCTNENQFEYNCLPNVSKVEVKLDALHEDLVGMEKDKHSWDGGWSEPGDNLPYDGNKRHVQSIQVYEYGGDKYIVTSLSDENNNVPAVQLIKTKEFGSEDGGMDEIVKQDLYSYYSDWSRFDHPGGSQLIGQFLFVALEDFNLGGGSPATGVWWLSEDDILPWYLWPTTGIPGGDYHQSTVGVTKLADGYYLLAACVGPDACDNINFYKSRAVDLFDVESKGFDLIDTWNRTDDPPLGLPDDGNNWDECGPQNMNLVAQDDGNIYLVLFGGVNRGIQEGDASGCVSGTDYDEFLYGYKLEMEMDEDENEQISLVFTNKVDVIPNSHICGEGAFPSLVLAPELHGLNFLAGSGLWLSPGGNDHIAYLATEHYDSCGADFRGVNGNTRWGVSENWNRPPLLTVDSSSVTVNEGQEAVNSGTYFDLGDITLSASVGSIAPDAGKWTWSWITTDGPDDSQTVEITRRCEYLNQLLPSYSRTFDLVVNNVPPTADAGPNQVVECVYGEPVFLNANGSSDPGMDTLVFAWDFVAFPGGGAPTFDDPSWATPAFQPGDLGTYEAEVIVTDDDSASDADTVVIQFEDTTPPVISGVSATPNPLWPPNGKMVPVEVSVLVGDACDKAPECSIFSITSNEPEGRKADSNITGDFTAELRAERLGTGTGRVYTITVKCTDGGGNASTETTAVTVPHDQDDDKDKDKK